MTRIVQLSSIILAGIVLAACTGGRPGLGDASRGDTGSDAPASEAKTRFDLANGCYALRSQAAQAFATVADGSYTATADSAAAASPLFMKPATLGEYLIHTADNQLLVADTGVSTAATPTDAAIWVVDTVAEGVYVFASKTEGTRLAVDEAGSLILSDSDGEDTHFTAAGVDGCTAYPEMPTGIADATYKGNGVNQPIIGFADVHTHMGMSSEMSLDDSVGPSAGGVLYGAVVHRFGVPHALEDCEEFHGPEGIRDANNVLEANPTGMHDTQGWPTFVDWPARNFLTHQVMYYRWVERAYKAGLRLMVNHGTNIAALCRVGQNYSLMPEADCDDMSVALKQVQYLKDIQDYVDAQEGGPGEGWFRIVRSPQEAREVINDGKMAVVLGVEVAQVLDCGYTKLPDGTEIRNCTQESIDAKIDELWELGVRHIYPYHDIDSSLGGTGIFSGDVINYLNFMDTGAFWETTECREHPTDEPAVRFPGAEMTTSSSSFGGDPISGTLFAPIEGAAPLYPPGKRCNARTVTDLGEYALRALMAKRMVIDIDHAAYHSKDIMLDIADEQTPPYPFASTHDAHGGLTSDQAIRILANGGIIFPYKGNGIKHRDFLEKVKFWREQAGPIAQQMPLAVGYGADANGFGGHPGPRGADSDPVEYPFTLFRGEGWGSKFQSLPPVTVEMLSIPESGKYWHIDEVGMANYGLVADFVEEVRLEAGEEGLDALYNSAEAYVQMWERVFDR